MTERAASGSRIKVWDLLVRIGHWTLVLGIVAAWLTRHGAGKWHEWLGYIVLGVVALRVVWGLTGSRYARFIQFVRSPATTAHYAKQILNGNEPRHIGHNPLGGWMIVALIIMITAVCASGWLYTTDEFWGVKWVEELHEGLTNFMRALVALHIGGVVYSTWRHRENLVAAMFNGRKRAPGECDVT